MKSNKLHVARRLSLGAAAVTLAATSVFAQTPAPELPAPSPAAKVEQRVGVTDFAVKYSSPAVKGRKVWGELVPFEELWRTGANAATTLEASKDFTFGGAPVPAGTYALYMIPSQAEWTAILNSNAKASGTRDYDAARNVASVKVKAVPAPGRERMTFLFSDTTDSGTTLDLEWAELRVSVPITVDTKSFAMKNIEATLGEAWRPHFASARWLLDSGGDLDTALGYIDTSIGIRETWWNHWVKAQIVGKKGDKAAALASAEKAKVYGAGDPVFEGFFLKAVDEAIAGWK